MERTICGELFQLIKGNRIGNINAVVEGIEGFQIFGNSLADADDDAVQRDQVAGNPLNLFIQSLSFWCGHMVVENMFRKNQANTQQAKTIYKMGVYNHRRIGEPSG